jgi:hypothetical protein
MKPGMLLLALLTLLIACGRIPATDGPGPDGPKILAPDGIASAEIRKVLESAEHQTQVTNGYTQRYFVIKYPNGDVPEDTGACTDVIIRSFRAAGLDLQKAVHEDMAANFSKYPAKWGLAAPEYENRPSARTESPGILCAARQVAWGNG